MNFINRNVLITGASRGIGKAIAIKLAAEGANVAIASKTVEEHPKLEGTIYSAAKEACLLVACPAAGKTSVEISFRQFIYKPARFILYQ